MRKRQDPYSLENIVAAIDLVAPYMTDAEKRAVLQQMTDDVERCAAELRAQRLARTSGTEPT